MFDKGVRIMRRLYLELKNQRFYYFVPLIVLFLLVPLIIHASIKGRSDSFLTNCSIYIQLFVPCFAAWWPILVLKEYLHSPGKELLYVNKNHRQDTLLLKMLVLWIIYIFDVLVLFIYFKFTFMDFFWFLFVAIVAQSAFMIAVGYFLSMLFQNTFVPMILNFTYSLVFMLALLYSPLSIFYIGSFSVASSLNKTPIVVIITLIFFYGGYLMEKRLYKSSI